MTIFVNINFVMFGELIRNIRKKKGLNLRELSALIGMDQTLISRVESGERLPKESQLQIIADALSISLNDLKKEWMAEKVLKIVQYSPMAQEVLAVAESRIEYLSGKNVFNASPLNDDLKALMKHADELHKRWNASQPLNQTQLHRLNEYFDVAYTFESNRIEGNTLTLQETKLIAVEGLTIGGKSVIEHLEAINHQEAISFVRDLATNQTSISRRVLLEIHRLILKEVDTSHAGIYRSVPVRISGSEHLPPQPYLIEKLMEDFFEFYHYQEKRLHPVILAAEMHERLVSIHPFIDGNGRTARLLMNLILLKNGFTRVNIKGDTASRMKYYQCLEKVQIDNDRDPFYELVIKEAIRSLEEHLELVG